MRQYLSELLLFVLSDFNINAWIFRFVNNSVAWYSTSKGMFSGRGAFLLVEFMNIKAIPLSRLYPWIYLRTQQIIYEIYLIILKVIFNEIIMQYCNPEGTEYVYEILTCSLTIWLQLPLLTKRMETLHFSDTAILFLK